MIKTTVVRVSRYDKWSADYIIPTNDEDKASEIAFQYAKRMFSCDMPATKELMSDDIKIISIDAELITI